MDLDFNFENDAMSPSPPRSRSPGSCDPLQMEEILREIFKYVESNDLPHMRQVCRSWNAIACKVIRKRRDLWIRLDFMKTRSTQFLNFLLDPRSSHATLPSNLFLDNLNPLFEYDLRAYNEDSENHLNDISIQHHGIIIDICEILGKRRIIKHLVMSWCGQYSIRFLTAYFLRILLHFSKDIESLEIHDVCARDKRISFPNHYVHYKPSSGVDVLQHLDNNDIPPWELNSLKKLVIKTEQLNSLTLKDLIQRSPCLREVVTHLSSTSELEVLTKLGEESRFTHIKSLKMSSLDKNNLEALIDAASASCLGGDGLALEEFNVMAVCADVRGERLGQFIRSQGWSLQSLVLGSTSYAHEGLMIHGLIQDIRIDIGLCPHLTRFGLYQREGGRITIQNLTYALDTPKLQFIELQSPTRDSEWRDYFCYSANVEDSGEILPCPSVTGLALSIPEVGDSHCCTYLGELFPNVKTITIDSPKTTFLDELCRVWSLSLVELNLIFYPTSSCNTWRRDAILFGMGERAQSHDLWLQQLYSEPFPNSSSSSQRQMGFSNSNSNDEVTGGILKLKQLQRLTIKESAATDVNILLSDFSVYHGFTKMGELNSLKIRWSEISKAAEDYLRRQMPLLKTLNTNFGHYPWDPSLPMEVQEYFLPNLSQNQHIIEHNVVQEDDDDDEEMIVDPNNNISSSDEEDSSDDDDDDEDFQQD